VGICVGIEMNHKLEMIKSFTGNMSEPEGLALMKLASKSYGDILEIGAYMGKSTSYLSLGAGNKTVYTIDLWNFREIDHEKRINKGGKADIRQWHSPETYKQFLNNIEAIDTENILPIKGISQEIAKVWNIQLGMVFIDGAHDYKSVHLDYEGFTKHLSPGGILAMHDYVLRDVRRLIDEVVRPSGLWHNIEIINDNLFIATRMK
jgi:predicted O-methyltransferase YrrM